MYEKIKRAEDSLEDHELLEVLLFGVIPRVNTNDTAHRLISAFGSLGGVFEADFEKLVKIAGVGESTAAHLRSIAAIYHRMNSGKKESLSAASYANLSNFLHEWFKGAEQEYILLMALDKKDKVRSKRSYTSEDKNSASLSVGEISKFLAESGAAKLVVAHNHLTNACYPSPEDDRFTELVQTVCSTYNVEFADHIIVCPADMYSYFVSGKLHGIKQNFNLAALMGNQRK